MNDVVPDRTDDDGAIASAVAAALGALLTDKDVSSVDVVEGGLPEVIRRGRRERMQLLIEGPLFEIVRERLAPPAGDAPSADVTSANATRDTVAAARFALPAHVHLVAAMLHDGRVALRLRRPAPTDVSLAHLVEEGLLPSGVDAELAAAAFGGQGVVVVGPAAAAADRVAVAVVRATSARLRVWSLGDDVPAQTMPPPQGKTIIERARVACALGADALCGVGLTVVELVALLGASLPCPVFASVKTSSVRALSTALSTALSPVPLDVAGVVVVVAFDTDGIPRVVELHGDTAAAAPPPSAAPRTRGADVHDDVLAVAADIDVVTAPARFEGGASRRGSPPAVVDVAAGLAEAPPADWASDNIDDDPGWELGPIVDEPAPQGSFDAALQSVAKRPSFHPSPPRPHPQAAALRGTGGLTFEPPPGGADES
jgi:hypothetical protein